jgi:SAM-dependent methyltransferase
MNSTQRFSSRVENYVKYRPSYPPALVQFLAKECGLSPNDVIADIGSGTGLLTKLFLDNGNHVMGVEPNREMREAGERFLAACPNFISVDGTAEATTLNDASVDAVIAGQAFHWFDIDKARREFLRILKPAGWVALIWNARRVDSSPFQREYDQLLRTYSEEYARTNHQDAVTDEAIEAFFDSRVGRARFDNAQQFDFDGLLGRLMSSSYAPEAGHPSHAPLVKALRDLFDKHQRAGVVTFEYDTEVYFGRLDA